MSPTVRAAVRVSTNLYQNLVTAYEKLSKKSFEKAINDHQDALRSDSLLGLARQALAAIDKHRIRQLTEVSIKECGERKVLARFTHINISSAHFQTFITLSLQDISRRADLKDAAEAERLLVHMVRPGCPAL